MINENPSAVDNNLIKMLNNSLVGTSNEEHNLELLKNKIKNGNDEEKKLVMFILNTIVTSSFSSFASKNNNYLNLHEILNIALTIDKYQLISSSICFIITQQSYLLYDTRNILKGILNNSSDEIQPNVIEKICYVILAYSSNIRNLSSEEKKTVQSYLEKPEIKNCLLAILNSCEYSNFRNELLLELILHSTEVNDAKKIDIIMRLSDDAKFFSNYFFVKKTKDKITLTDICDATNKIVQEILKSPAKELILLEWLEKILPTINTEKINLDTINKQKINNLTLNLINFSKKEEKYLSILQFFLGKINHIISAENYKDLSILLNSFATNRMYLKIMKRIQKKQPLELKKAITEYQNNLLISKLEKAIEDNKEDEIEELLLILVKDDSQNLKSKKTATELCDIATEILLNKIPFKGNKKIALSLLANYKEHSEQYRQNYFQTIETIFTKNINFTNYNDLLEQILNHNEKDSVKSKLKPRKKEKSINKDIKNRKKLLKELSKLNKDNTDIYKGHLKSIDEEYKKLKKYKKTKLKEEINNWKENKANIHKIIAIIKRVNKLVTGQKPRDTQIIALLSMLLAKDGILAQIKTGEGKTSIIAMFAVIKALEGGKIDIATSSPILAERDAKAKEKFYNFFDLTVSHNKNDKIMLNKVKDCYRSHVVYSSVNNFQFDLLREEFQLKPTRGHTNIKDNPILRSFEDSIVIVDEVDNMLVDGGAHLAMLASPSPGMENLRNILIDVWSWLEEYELKEEYIKEKERLSVNLKEHIDRLIEYADLPLNLKKLATKQRDLWVRHAISAKYEYKLNTDYIITEKQSEKIIAPIDRDNTGIIQNGTTWSDGLHQFLQIKHKLCVTCENFTTSFISNIGYFKRYPSIYGVTGTLGSKKEKELLQKTYNKIAFIEIPTFKKTRFKLHECEVVNDEGEKINAIIADIKKEILNERAVLVICKSIDEGEKITKQLVEKYYGNIKCYLRDDLDSKEAIEKELHPGDVIVATNLAGRGTDINVSKELEYNGGLHVCLTFLPKNQRVEDQALGRTARQGKPGTGKLIFINKYKHIKHIDGIKQKRNKQEKDRINKIIKHQLKRINTKDILFRKFAELKKQLTDKADPKDLELFSTESNNNKIHNNLLIESIYNEKHYKDVIFFNEIRAVEDEWGIWLKLFSEQDFENEEQMINKFEYEFKNKIQKDLEIQRNAIKNTAYLNLDAIIMRHQGKYSESIEVLEDAINLDPHSFVSYYNLAISIINNAKIQEKMLFDTIKELKDGNTSKEVLKDIFARIARNESLNILLKPIIESLNILTLPVEIIAKLLFKSFIKNSFKEIEIDGNQYKELALHNLKLAKQYVSLDIDNLYKLLLVKEDNQTQLDIDAKYRLLIICRKNIEDLIKFIDKNQAKELVIDTYTKLGIHEDIKDNFDRFSINELTAIGIEELYSIKVQENISKEIVSASLQFMYVGGAFIGLSFISPMLGKIGCNLVIDGLVKIPTAVLDPEFEPTDFMDQWIDEGIKILLSFITNPGSITGFQPSKCLNTLKDKSFDWSNFGHLVAKPLLYKFECKAKETSKELMAKIIKETPIFNVITKVLQIKEQLNTKVQLTLTDNIEDIIDEILGIKNSIKEEIIFQEQEEDKFKVQSLIEQMTLIVAESFKDISNLYKIFANTYNSVKNFFVWAKDKIMSIKELLKGCIESFKKTMKSNIIERLIHVSKLISEGEQLYNSLKDGVNVIKDQITNLFKKITECFKLESLISNLKQNLSDNFEKAKATIKESIKNLGASDFIYFIKQKIIIRTKNYIHYLIDHNPIERYLQRNGIDLSSVDGFINNISNLGTNLLFELFKKTLRKGLNKIKSNNSGKNILLLEEKSDCVHVAISNICQTTKEKLTIATGIVSGENGASIEESLLILDVLGLNAKVSKKLLKCEARLVEEVLTDENTDQGIFFISGKHIGHAQKFYKENSDLLTIDGEQFNNDKVISSNKGVSLRPYNGSNNTHILTVYNFTTQSAKFKAQEIEKMQSGYRFTTGEHIGELFGGKPEEVEVLIRERENPLNKIASDILTIAYSYHHTFTPNTDKCLDGIVILHENNQSTPREKDFSNKYQNKIVFKIFSTNQKIKAYWKEKLSGLDLQLNYDEFIKNIGTKDETLDRNNVEKFNFIKKLCDYKLNEDKIKKIIEQTTNEIDNDTVAVTINNKILYIACNYKKREANGSFCNFGFDSQLRHHIVKLLKIAEEFPGNIAGFYFKKIHFITSDPKATNEKDNAKPHAEMQLVKHIGDANIKYIGVTKACCAKCEKELKVKSIRFPHFENTNNDPKNWQSPEEISTQLEEEIELENAFGYCAAVKHRLQV